MTLSPSDIERIEASEGWRKHRVEVLSLAMDVNKVVVKGQRPPRSVWGYAFLSALAKWYGLPWLQAAPAYDGSKAQEREFAQLESFRSAGVLAPLALHQGVDYLVMSYLEGREFWVVLHDAAQKGQGSYLETWHQGLRALHQLHRKGLNVSQAFARNMILTKEGIAFIDFEDNPLEVMTVLEAQVRDYALYLHSTALCLEDYAKAKAVFLSILELEPEVWGLLRDGARKLAWLRHLPAHPTRYGRDTWRIQKLGVFLGYLSQ
jgi:hypothetical protein